MSRPESIEELLKRLKLSESRVKYDSRIDVNDDDQPNADLMITNFKLASDTHSCDPMYKKYPPSTINYRPGRLLCTSIPTSDLAHGVTECLIPSEFKSQILAIPDFPRAPLPSPEDIYTVFKPYPYTIGLGISANRDIQFGELIISERPIMLFPADIRVPYNGEIPIATIREFLIDFVAARMRDEDISAMYSLQNVHTEYAGSLLQGIFDTNTMIAKFGSEKYVGITKEISLVNHSCHPNAILRFDWASFSFVLHAVRKIGEREQITISYVGSSPDAQTLVDNVNYLRQKYKIPHYTAQNCFILQPLKTQFDIFRKATTLADYFQNHVQTFVQKDLYRVYHDSRRLITLMTDMKLEACEEMMAVVVVACKAMSLLHPPWFDHFFVDWARTLAKMHEGKNGVRYLEIVRLWDHRD